MKRIKQIINLTQFATMDEVITGNPDKFGEGNSTKEQFETVSQTLKDLGYDILINHREKAEFVPSSRLSDVVSQREAFKAQAQSAIDELNNLKSQKGMSPEAQAQLTTLITQNEGLISQLQEANLHVEIMGAASDAMNPKDVIPFVNMDALKIGKDGKISSGLKEEIDRLRTEKPYLFNAGEVNQNKGGFDPNNSGGKSGGKGKADMNAAIRAAAFGGRRSF